MSRMDAASVVIRAPSVACAGLDRLVLSVAQPVACRARRARYALPQRQPWRMSMQVAAVHSAPPSRAFPCASAFSPRSRLQASPQSARGHLGDVLIIAWEEARSGVRFASELVAPACWAVVIRSEAAGALA